MELPGVVPRLILELAEDFANDGVIYGELRVSPRIPLLNGELEQFLATVSAAVTEARARFLIDLRIIFGFERQRFYQLSTTEQDDAVARILRACERYCGSVVVGFDLWGIEDRHPPRAFERLFRAIRQAGYPLTIHAGEAHSSTFIREAIEVLQCNRLGHATAITRDPRLFELIRQRDILVEVCLTSNWITGIVEDLGSHPLRRMLTERIPVTLCTDNTLVYNTSLSRELAVALQLELISAAAVPRLFSSAAAHVFAPDVSPDALVTVLTRAYTLQATDHLASVASEARRLDD
jgi:adenosine deaminase